MFYGNLNDWKIRYVKLECEAIELYGTEEAILVHPDDREALFGFMKSERFRLIPHKEGRESGFVFLYSMHPLECWQSGQGTTVTVFYQLGCHGLLPCSYIPLDKTINKAVWKNRYLKQDVFYMDLPEQMIFVLVQAIFHFKEFTPDLIRSIEAHSDLLENEEWQDKLRVVFFGFTERLLSLLKNRQYAAIVMEYITFQDY